MDIEGVGADLADSRVDEIEGDGDFRALRALSVGHALGPRAPRLRESQPGHQKSTRSPEATQGRKGHPPIFPATRSTGSAGAYSRVHFKCGSPHHQKSLTCTGQCETWLPDLRARNLNPKIPKPFTLDMHLGRALRVCAQVDLRTTTLQK